MRRRGYWGGLKQDFWIYRIYRIGELSERRFGRVRQIAELNSLLQKIGVMAVRSRESEFPPTKFCTHF